MQVGGSAGQGSLFIGNTATNQGGAIFLQSPTDVGVLQILYTNTMSNNGTGFPMTEASPGLPPQYYYMNAFINNSAGVQGGAIAVSSYRGFSIASVTHEFANASADPNTFVYTLFQGNYAPVGGALSLITTPSDLSHVLFLNNTATLPTTPRSGLEAHGCGLGQGGAICIVGDNQTVFSGQSLKFFNNTAAFGGGISLHASPTCTPEQAQLGCFTVTLDANTTFHGNSAVDGAGGAIFWANPGNLFVDCGGSTAVVQGMSDAAGSLNPVSVDVQPCSSWELNSVTAAGYGPVIASTPFYLEPGTQAVPYYSSNQPLLLNVTMQVSGADVGILAHVWFTRRLAVLQG